MKNKVELKKLFVSFIIIIPIIVIIFSSIFIYQYKEFTNEYNKKTISLINNIRERYKDISDTEIASILNQDNYDEEFIKKYGLVINNDSIIKKNNNKFYIFLVINIICIFISLIVLCLLFFRYLSKRDKDIKEITKCIEEINKKNYELKIDSMSEDELSILKNEIYKTTIMLKEAAENSLKDKDSLKRSLEDISHQLKTPLTSISVMLDNILEDPDMDPSIRYDFLMDIKHNTYNINFLVQSLLKLSKFDANTVSFIKNKYSVKSIVDESIKNVSILSDLKNTNIDVILKNDSDITCDFKWQVEAVTNILKNAIDHSKEGINVKVTIDSNNVYSLIEIKDNGEGISSKDLPHIFERFYKGSNSSSDSVGIGLALAKTIVEEDNGMLQVDSSKEGTTFSIKYFKM